MLLHLLYLLLWKKLQSVLNFGQNVSWKLLEIVPADLLDTLWCHLGCWHGWEPCIRWGYRSPMWRGNFEAERRQPIVKYNGYLPWAGKKAEPIKMPFGMWTRVSPRNHVLDGVQIPHVKRQFWGEKGLAQDMPEHVWRSIYSKRFGWGSTDMVQMWIGVF